MNWHKHSSDLLVLQSEDGTDTGYYIVAHRTPRRPTWPKSEPGWYYNAWRGNYNDREKREYVTAGDELDDCKRVCEKRVKVCA